MIYIKEDHHWIYMISIAKLLRVINHVYINMLQIDTQLWYEANTWKQ